MLDSLIPFDFSVEHKSGAKIVLADLSRFAEPVSQYDSMFTVAKMKSISKTFGLRKSPLSGGPVMKQQYASSKHVSTNRNLANNVQKRPLKSYATCENSSANRNQTRYICRRSSKRNLKIVVAAFTNLKERDELFIDNSKLNEFSNNIIEKAFRKIERFLERHPSINTSENENEMEELEGNPQLQAITTEMTTTKVKTVLSIPSAFPEATFQAEDPKTA